MTLETTSLIATLFFLAQVSVNGFSFQSIQTVKCTQSLYSQRNTRTKLHMGLFDGVKEAFQAPTLERSFLDAQRETPIDRWMGWNAKSTEEKKPSAISTATDTFIDSMDPIHYVQVKLQKPMGIIFEENDGKVGGIFVVSLKEGGIAEKNGLIKAGDQLVAVNDKKVAGMSFDDALGTIVATETPETKLILFRGTAQQLYGPLGASKAWLEEFISKGA